MQALDVLHRTLLRSLVLPAALPAGANSILVLIHLQLQGFFICTGPVPTCAPATKVGVIRARAHTQRTAQQLVFNWCLQLATVQPTTPYL